MTESTKIAEEIRDSLIRKGVKPNLIVLSEASYNQLCNEANEKKGGKEFKPTKAMKFMGVDTIGGSFIAEGEIACYYKE